jgi:hypothetical protein
MKNKLHRGLASLLLPLLAIASAPLFTASVNAQLNQQNHPSHNQVSASGLTPKQQEYLHSLGIKIAVPSYIPNGFRVSDVQITPCPANAKKNANGVCRFGPSYTIIYRNPHNNCFEVNAIGGGIGGPDGKYSRKVNSKILGEVDLNISNSSGVSSQPISEAIGKLPQANIWTFPAGTSPFYQVATIEGKAFRDGKSTFCSDRAYMTPDELTKIVQSLDWLP